MPVADAEGRCSPESHAGAKFGTDEMSVCGLRLTPAELQEFCEGAATTPLRSVLAQGTGSPAHIPPLPLQLLDGLLVRSQPLPTKLSLGLGSRHPIIDPPHQSPTPPIQIEITCFSVMFTLKRVIFTLEQVISR